MNIFGCKHPFDRLSVEKHITWRRLDNEFYEITIHLYCDKCKTPLDKKYAKLVGGVKGFLNLEDVR